MLLDVVATWNENVLFSGRLRSPISLSDFLPDRTGMIADAQGRVVVPEGFSRDEDGALTSGDLRIRVAPRAPFALRRAPHIGLALAAACASLALHGGALEVSRATPVDAKSDEAERQSLIHHLLSAQAEVPPLEDAHEGATGTKAKGEEGAMGSPRVDARVAAVREAAEFGMIGIIGSGSTIGDAFGHGSSGVERGSIPADQEWSGVRAGEWDDNLTLREFRRVLVTSSSLPLEPLDVSVRRVIVARDSDGRALASCPVTVSDARGRALTLRTTSSGRALFFPRAEHFAGRLVAALRCGGNAASREFDTNAEDGIVLLDGREPRDARTAPIDVAFALDTTGSMSEEIAAVKATLVTVAARTTNVRVGLVEYKDRSDDYVTRVFQMSGNLPHFSQAVAMLNAGGGGDTPEAVNLGIHDALTSLEWNEDAPARLLFVIGDAPPHEHDPGPSYADEAKQASHGGIQMFPIAASGMDTFGQIVFRQLAQFTGGTEMFVLRGGAGPQSTGGGDPVTSCGHTQTQYKSGNLDALVLAKIDAARRALDEDPLAVRGIGQDVVSTCVPSRAQRGS